MGAYVTYGPAREEAFAVADVIELPVQVNGKVRGRVQLARKAFEADARGRAGREWVRGTPGRAGGAEVRLRGRDGS